MFDSLEIAAGKRLSVFSTSGGFSALPMVQSPDGSWRRAAAGDGVSEALLRLLAETPGTQSIGSFTLHSWSTRAAAGERAIGVDQTNESVVVGDSAVVKWATHLSLGPHPAPHRITTLRQAGFTGMPTPWGLVTWHLGAGPETLVASVDAYLPGAVDGWTWAVDLITDAALRGSADPWVAATREVGAVIADMHAALATRTAIATQQDAARWQTTARETLDIACSLADSAAISYARSHRAELVALLDTLGDLAGTPVLDGHGDLHVGQVLRSAGRFYVTDFDGNPVLDSEEQVLPIPAIVDIAGMLQSLVHAAIVARKYTELDTAALAFVDLAGRSALLHSYTARLTTLDHGDLYRPAGLRAFRAQQILREMIYAAVHLPRWMYVPDAALPALLDEGRDR